jgi:GGDEF domain-containing protein
MVMSGTYNYWLVAFSVVLAMLGSRRTRNRGAAVGTSRLAELGHALHRHAGLPPACAASLRELTVLHQAQSLGAITVSIGVAAVPQHGTSPKELIEAADAAL